MKSVFLGLILSLSVPAIAQTTVVCCNGTGTGGSGTVTSVDATVPAEMTITGNPITTAGTFAFGWASQNTNLVFGSPCGSSGVPIFRSLCASDIPASIGSSTSGNAATATALAANGTNCSAPNFARGVDASGNCEGAAIVATDLPSTTVTPGAYTSANITVDAQGRITAAASGGGGSGDVVGPASATDNAIARYDTTTGKLLQNSLAEVTDAGELKLAATLGNGIYFGTDTDTKWSWRTDNTLAAYAQASEVLRLSTADQISYAANVFHVSSGTLGGDISESFAQEAVTLSTGGTTTVTSGSLAKANSRIKAIVYRVNTTIATATDFSIKVTGGNNFVRIGTATTAQTGLTATSTGVLVAANYADQFIASDTTLTITTTGTPSAGVIRVAVIYEKYSPPGA